LTLTETGGTSPFMPAFLIADVDVKDPDSYRAYREANPDVVRHFGGRYIALGGETRVLEGDWVPHRTIIIEFPDMETLSRFYESPEYEKLKPIRWRSADSRLLAMETLEEPID
jgi:uncharacterized protein (DUF1330 family)